MTVKNAFSEVNVTGNFVNYGSFNPLFFNNTTSTAVIEEDGLGDSSLSTHLYGGIMYYLSADKRVTIFINISISGSEESNLHPSVLILGLSSNGSANEYKVMTQTWGASYGGNNTSLPYSVATEGYMSASTNIKLINEPQWSPSSGYKQSRYNFSFNLLYQIDMWSFTGTHTFGIWAELGGLSETPVASVNITTTDTW